MTAAAQAHQSPTAPAGPGPLEQRGNVKEAQPAPPRHGAPCTHRSDDAVVGLAGVSSHVGSPRATDSGRDPRGPAARARATSSRPRRRPMASAPATPPPAHAVPATMRRRRTRTARRGRERARSAASPPPNAMPIDAAGCARARASPL